VGRKSGKITAARKALERWSETFDYDAAAGQAFEEAKAEKAARFAAKVKASKPELLTRGPGGINLTIEDQYQDS